MAKEEADTRGEVTEEDIEAFEREMGGEPGTTTDVALVQSHAEKVRYALEKMEERLAETPLKTVNQLRKEAGLPMRASTEDMGKHPAIVILRARPQEALLPDTGEKSQGYLLLWRPKDRREYYQTFVGATVLKDVLQDIAPPFITRVQRIGRAWQFVDP